MDGNANQPFFPNSRRASLLLSTRPGCICRLAAMHSYEAYSEKSPLLAAHYQHAPAAAPYCFTSQTRLDRASWIRSAAVKLLAAAAIAGLAISKLLHAGQHAAGIISPSDSAVSWKTEPFNPTSLALAVRSPYLNVWLEGGNRARQGLLTSQYGDSRSSDIASLASLTRPCLSCRFQRKLAAMGRRNPRRWPAIHGHVHARHRKWIRWSPSRADIDVLHSKFHLVHHASRPSRPCAPLLISRYPRRPR